MQDRKNRPWAPKEDILGKNCNSRLVVACTVEDVCWRWNSDRINGTFVAIYKECLVFYGKFLGKYTI